VAAAPRDTTPVHSPDGGVGARRDLEGSYWLLPMGSQELPAHIGEQISLLRATGLVRDGKCKKTGFNQGKDVSAVVCG